MSDLCRKIPEFSYEEYDRILLEQINFWSDII